MSSRRRDDAASDEHLIARARDRDQAAFGMLYERHRDAALRAARCFRGVDADDLVNEAFVRVYACLTQGGGPRGAFRPYLFRTIHNVALDWLRRPAEIAMDGAHLAERIDDRDASPDAAAPVESALDRSLTVRAFRSLPERWQNVLWYTEVEGLDPHEVAPLLGLTPNGVAALAYRARDGLRTAWLNAHVESAGLAGECRWVTDHVAQSARHTLSPADEARRDRHLAACTRCAVIVEEVDDVGARLALVLLPLILGAGAATAFASTSSSVVVAHPIDGAPLAPALSEPAVMSVPLDASVSLATAGAPIASAPVAATPVASVGATTAAGALAVSLAAPALVVGGMLASVVETPVVADAREPGAITAAAPGSDDDGDRFRLASRAGAGDISLTVDPGALPREDLSGWVRVDVSGETSAGAAESLAADGDDPASPLGAVVEREGQAIADVVGGVIDTVTGGAPPVGHSAPGGVVGADVSLAIDGTGTPGATVSAQAAGQVYATATVGADGTFRLIVTALPQGVEQLEVVQAVDRAYLQRLLPGVGGLLDGLLGGVDRLIDGLIVPVSLATSSVAGVSIVTGG